MSSEKTNLLTHLDNIIRLPSVSSADARIDMSNKPVIDYLATEFTALGFDCELVPSGKKFNLIACKGSGSGGLVLSGHTDTVPYDEALWSVPPLELTERDGKLFGLGVTDMKGFFPLVIEAVKPLLNETFHEPLLILATADEEVSMAGARQLAELGKPRARSALIGEPTGLKPVRAHKGVMLESVRLMGHSGHSSNPALGRNALDAMHAVMTELITFREELGQRYQSELFSIPHPTLNLGVIHGGDNPNRICGHCQLEFDIRLVPGMYIDEVREEIRQRILRVTEPLEIEFELVPLFPGVEAFAAADDSLLLSAAEKLTGHEAVSVAFATEGPFLQTLGLDTIILGPGNIDQAHQPDEYLSMDRLQPYIDLLRKLITQQCLV
ncbi:MAG: acetylornithine deacetylase [Pseudohongiellaceae bacterium]